MVPNGVHTSANRSPGSEKPPMNNIQIAHLIVKALNNKALYRRYTLDNRNKMLARMHMLTTTPATNMSRASNMLGTAWTGGPLALGRAVQVLAPLLKDPGKCFTALAKETPDSLVAKTIKYFLEHGV